MSKASIIRRIGLALCFAAGVVTPAAAQQGWIFGQAPGSGYHQTQDQWQRGNCSVLIDHYNHTVSQYNRATTREEQNEWLRAAEEARQTLQRMGC